MWRRIDLVLRFVYVAALPFALFSMASKMPITGLLVGALLATAVALFGSERWRERVRTIPVAGRFLANMARAGDYYSERPPRPVVFYIFYPIVLPYVLINRSARTEFLLFRRLNIVALLILVATNTYEYFRHWYPDLPFDAFAGTVTGLLIVQILVTAMMIMPVATTVILFHQRAHRRTLLALGACATLLFVAGLFTHFQSDDKLPLWTSARLYARSRTYEADAARALERGLDAAVTWARTHPIDRKDAAAVEAAGRAMETHAVEALETFYPHDEASAFHLYGDTSAIVLFVKEGPREAIWLAYHRGKATHDPAKLSPTVRAALRLD